MENSVLQEYTEKKLSRYAHGNYSIGDRIRAYDFKPREGVEGYFIEGTIVDLVRTTRALSWKVNVDRDSAYEDEPYPNREIVFVPLEVALDEWENRVSLAPGDELETTEQKVFNIVKELVEPFDGYDSSEITEVISAKTDLSLRQVSGYLSQLVQKELIEKYEMEVNGKDFHSFSLK